MSIEQRGAQLARKLKDLSDANGGARLHLVTHSFCGVDARAAISLFNASASVQSLSTVCSPHHGLKMIDSMNRSPDKFMIEKAEKAIEAVGLSQKSALEFTSENIADFNKVAENVLGVDYYSIGAQKSYALVSDLLKHSHEAISRDDIRVSSDGIVRPEEAKWGNYLITYEQDHLEMAGFNADYQPVSPYTLLADNIKLSEIKNDPRTAREYGVDHLFKKE